MIENLFTISDANKGKWLVRWPQRGAVYDIIAKETIAELAVDSGSYEIGLVSDSGQTLFIDAILFETRGFSSSFMVRRLPNVAAALFDSRQCAEKFVDLMEKHIVWRHLKKQHEPGPV